MTSGLFKRSGRGAGTRKNLFGGSAGNSASNNKPTSGDGYKEGMLGWREGRQAGGQSISQKVAEKPIPTDTRLDGHGGLAFDRSAAAAMNDSGRPSDAYAETGKSRSR